MLHCISYEVRADSACGKQISKTSADCSYCVLTTFEIKQNTSHHLCHKSYTMQCVLFMKHWQKTHAETCVFQQGIDLQAGAARLVEQDPEYISSYLNLAPRTFPLCDRCENRKCYSAGFICWARKSVFEVVARYSIRSSCYSCARARWWTWQALHFHCS